MDKRREKNIELIAILFVFVVVNITSQVFQNPITYNNGRGWDGVAYYRVAEQFADGHLPSADAPYVYRIGTPLLASKVSKSDLLFGFKVQNILANLVTAVLLTLWLRRHLGDWKIRTLLVTLFLVQWHGPTRWVYFYPAYTDPWLFAIILAGLTCIQEAVARPTFVLVSCLSLVALAGALFRETAIIIGIAFVFATNPVAFSRDFFDAMAKLKLSQVFKRPALIYYAPLAFGVLGLFATHMIASQTNEFSFLKTAVMWAYLKPLLTYLHGWLIAYGPLLIIPIYNWRRTTSFLVNNQYMLMFLIGLATLGWIGGTDTERILFWAMPVVYLLIGKSIEDNAPLLKSPPLVIVLVISQLVSERIFWTVPDYPREFSTPIPVLTLLSSKFQHLDLYSFHASRITQVISFSQYLALSVVLLLWLRSREMKMRL
jgi:hypothetical protein